jgi:hypothetical protein
MFIFVKLRDVILLPVSGECAPIHFKNLFLHLEKLWVVYSNGSYVTAGVEKSNGIVE